ncbi:MAG: 50S ribosomal protein L35 [Propionibacteriaceae bacterium]|nr:50S ribosomal protein L35 [Propionibacteriaceae bacterium]
MPKMKTHSGAKKRFKTTGSGKLMHRQANLGHLNAHKSARRIRRLSGNVEVVDVEAKKARKLLGKNKGR